MGWLARSQRLSASPCETRVFAKSVVVVRQVACEFFLMTMTTVPAWREGGSAFHAMSGSGISATIRRY